MAVNSPKGSNRLARTPIVGGALVTMTVVLLSCGRSDASVERDVRSRLIVDNLTAALNLTVTAERGKVRLSGVARTRRQYERALDIAREVVGADQVVNEMRLDEAPLATAVYAAVQQDPLVAAVPLEIDVSGQGIVVLRSNRTTEAQRTRLLQIASRVPGVVRVEDYLK
jgi:osmotically-inducible protein OsmY